MRDKLIFAIFLILLAIPLVNSQFVQPRGVSCIQFVEGRIYSCDNPVLSLGFPEDGSFVTRTAILSAGILSERFNTTRTEYVAFEYSFDRRNWYLIEDESENIEFLGWRNDWEINELPSGPIFIRILLRDIERKEWQDFIVININKPPVNEMMIGRDSENMILDGRNSFDPEGKIEKYTWLIDTQQPFELEGDIVFVPIDRLPLREDFGITLTTTDFQGGETGTHKLVNLPCRDCEFSQEEKTCGCTKMDVKDTGESDFDMWWMPAGKTKQLGAYDDVDLTKAGPFNLVHNFQVEADLTPKSDPNKCFEGQRVKQSVILAGRVEAKYKDNESILNNDGSFSKGAKIECGYNGDKWCWDGYNQTDSAKIGDKIWTVKKHIDQSKIVWIDGPGWETVGGKGIKKEFIKVGAEGKYNFEARVTGPAGSCRCNWDILMKVERNGTVSKNDLVNKNCDP